ncbi:MAG TPA: outer membrane protein assembly factor BamD [Bacteroidetes bacterium]|nr:outer membrane protein assembly factor BamD [Bacteroidota bacterium]
MKKRLIFPFFAVVFVLLLGSCKSEFEKIRASGDTELIYKKAFELYEQEEYLRSQTLFELIIPAYRGRPELEKIYFTYAYTYYYLNRFILSNYYFKTFSATFPTSDLKEEAEFMVAYSSYQLSPSYRLDQTYSIKAIEEFESFVNTYPQSERVKECNRLIDEIRLKLERKTFAEGQLYYNVKQYQAAISVLENLLKDFPETNNAEQIRRMIAKAAYNLANNSVYVKQQERYEQAVGYAKDYLAKFSDSKNFSEVKSIYNNSVKKLKSLTNGRYQDEGTGTGS